MKCEMAIIHIFKTSHLLASIFYSRLVVCCTELKKGKTAYIFVIQVDGCGYDCTDY